MTAVIAARDERLATMSVPRRLMRRPELGALIGAAAVFIFFAFYTEAFATTRGFANVLDPAATLGIMAVVVALLMIGGEFDLSAGVMTGTSGFIVAMLSTELGFNVWVAVAVAIAVGLAVGFINGVLVIRTGLPSFIVTLGTLLILQGLNLGITKLVTGTVQVRGLAKAPGYESARRVFASTMTVGGAEFRVTILWWIAAAAAAAGCCYGCAPVTGSSPWVVRRPPHAASASPRSRRRSRCS